MDFRAFRPTDAGAFRTLNEDWIREYFTLEAKDAELLNDPANMILARGGFIYVVEQDGVVVGCCALLAMEGGYEIGKMAVSRSCRGEGVGRGLLAYVIAEAWRLGAQRLFLETHPKLENAVHQYESIGFRHIPKDRWQASPYCRCEVQMEMLHP